jgi:hypothetical protein
VATTKLVQLLLLSEVTYVNYIDCRCGVVVAWWRGLGIFTPEPLAFARMNALPLYLISYLRHPGGKFDIDSRIPFQIS